MMFNIKGYLALSDHKGEICHPLVDVEDTTSLRKWHDANHSQNISFFKQANIDKENVRFGWYQNS